MTSLDRDLGSGVMSMCWDPCTVLGFRNALAGAGTALFREFKSKDINDAEKRFMVEGVPREGAPR
jgi:hypothetical protein